MAVLVDMTVDCEGAQSAKNKCKVSEVVDITDDSEDDDVTEVVKNVGGPPLLFGDYRRGRELGRGRSGQVFVCRRNGSSSSFAVKTVDLQRLKMSADYERTQKLMKRELEILRRLPPHRHVVQLAAAFEQGNWLLLVLELVAGGDLFTALMGRVQQRLFDREAAFVLRQLVCGLRFLHGQGIIHRDLKLENVLVASARRQKPLVLYSVKITDFGLSKAVGQGFSEARSAVGTKPYAAPEVLRGEAHGCSSDLWCLGILLFVLVAGHFPFESSVLLSEQDVEAKLNCPGLANANGSALEVLAGLLQLEPSRRFPLEDLANHPWLQGESPGKAGKRPCEATSDAPSLPTARARSRTARPVQKARSSVGRLQAEVPSVPFVDSDVEAAFKELMDLVNRPADHDHQADEFTEDPCPALAGEAPTLPLPCDRSSRADPHGDMDTSTPRGAWTPFAVESTVTLREVQPPSSLADVMQVRVVIADRFAGSVLGRNGARIQEIALTAGCRVWMTSRHGDSDRHIVMIGNFRQCKVAQELIHEQLSNAQNADWQDLEVEVVLLVRAEAAGVITGKQGFVLAQIQEQSGAQLQLLRQEVAGQRPCIITGSLQSTLRAEKHVFDLVKAVPVSDMTEPATWANPTSSSSEAAAAAVPRPVTL